MRIVVDMQGAQGFNRLRGIGRYSTELAQAMTRIRSDHEIMLVLSDLCPDTIMHLRDRFRGLLPSSAIRVWTAPGPVRADDIENADRRRQAERIREAFIASLDPDIVLVTSLFDSYGDDIVTSIATDTAHRTAVIIYDILPLVRPEMRVPDETPEDWYLQKIEHLKRASVLLSISESAEHQAIQHLPWASERIVNIATAAREMFSPVDLSPGDERLVKDRFGIEGQFLLGAGGIGLRNNSDGLITAFARLNEEIRSTHQLVIVGKASSDERVELLKTVKANGLSDGRVILTDHVSDTELLHLYNLCAACVFPSHHEPFGNSALEAMQCGAAVIASDRSSFTELVGRADALFNPEDVDEISRSMERVVVDNDFRRVLEENGSLQARRFSWDRTAAMVLSALSEACTKPRISPKAAVSARPRLAFVSPLPPERTGIADYSAELLRVLHKHYDIDVVVVQDLVTDTWIHDNLTIRTVEWFEANHLKYDRILYHFGNSHFHWHMFRLLEKTSGIVVLHDFFLSNTMADFWSTSWKEELIHSHGFSALANSGVSDPVWKYPANLSVLQSAIGTIVHSEDSRRLAVRYYGESAEQSLIVVPHLRSPEDRSATLKSEAKAMLGFPEDSTLICSFGLIGPTKLNIRLVEAFLQSSLARDPNAYVVFVGENHRGAYGKEFSKLIRCAGLSDRLRVTGWADSGTFARYLKAADIAVQLRTRSRGETSGTVLQCMAHGIPTIVNANGSLADLDPSAVRMLPDVFEAAALAGTLEQLAKDVSLREALGQRAHEAICAHHDPGRCAEAYRVAIERAYAGARAQVQNLVGKLPAASANEDDHRCLAHALSISFPAVPRKRTLFVDVSALARTDLHPGVQRAVRGLLDALLQKSGLQSEIMPVRLRADSSYGIAHDLMSRTFGLRGAGEDGCPIDFASGDVFLGLSFSESCPPEAYANLDRMRRFGVAVYFVVYDLLPLKLPEYYPPGEPDRFKTWVSRILAFDGVICISRTVSDELRVWAERHGPDSRQPCEISFFHPGADIQSSRPSSGLPDDGSAMLSSLSERPGFLIVGAVEPRKGVRQVLSAFELLWARGIDANLIIVGKQGRSVEDLASTLRTHQENGRRLFWPGAVSDEFLERMYAESTCLIAPSEGEGFGLPVIEAAQYKLPIIARDLPVFREVASDHASYFTGLAPADLADAIERWLEAWHRGMHIPSDKMPWITWEMSAVQLLKVIQGDALQRLC